MFEWLVLDKEWSNTQYLNTLLRILFEFVKVTNTVLVQDWFRHKLSTNKYSKMVFNIFLGLVCTISTPSRYIEKISNI